MRTEEPKAEDDDEAAPRIIPSNGGVLAETPTGSPDGDAHALRLGVGRIFFRR